MKRSLVVGYEKEYREWLHMCRVCGKRWYSSKVDEPCNCKHEEN